MAVKFVRKNYKNSKPVLNTVPAPLQYPAIKAQTTSNQSKFPLCAVGTIILGLVIVGMICLFKKKKSRVF